MILADPTKQNLTPNMIFADHTNQNLTPNIKFADHTNWNYKQHKSNLFNLFSKHQHRIWNTTSWNIWKPAPCNAYHRWQMYDHDTVMLSQGAPSMTQVCPGKLLNQGESCQLCCLSTILLLLTTFDAQMHIMEFSKYWAREDYIFVTVAKWHAAKCPWHRNAQAGCSIREGELSIMLLITHLAHPAPLWLPSAGHRLQWALTEHTKIRTSF